MPFTTQQLEQWLNGLGLPEDKRKVMLETLGSGDTLTKVGETVLLRSDYSRNLDDLKKKEAQLEADYQKRVAEEDKFRESLSGWKTQKEKEIEGKLTATRQEAEARLNAARDAVKRFGETHGLSQQEIDAIIPANASQTTDTVRTPQMRDDDGRFLSKEEFRREANAFARLPGLMVALDRTYYQLFGNEAPPPAWESLIERSEKERKTLTQVFNETYKIEEKRAEIAAATRKKEMDDAVAAAVTAERSKIYAEHPELSAPSGRRVEVGGSPVLTIARQQQKDGQAKLADPKDPMRGARAAASAWNEGRYKESA